MNVYLGHLSNCIPGSPVSTAVRSILDDAQAAGKRAPQHLPERTLPVRLPAGTVEWLRQQAERQTCAMAKVIRAYVADQAVSELTALYQHHTISPAGLIQGPALFLLYLANFVFQFRLLSTVRGDQGPGVEALR
jgi:hypothetical protein